MKTLRWAVLCLVLLGGVLACEPAPSPTEETPQPEIIELQITPAVEHWLPWVAQCAEGIPDLGIFVQVLPRDELSLERSDLILRLGERLDADPYVAVMGVENIVILAGDNVPVTSLSLETLRAIFAGQMTRWGDIPGFDPTLIDPRTPIKLLAYPDGHEITILFRRAYLDDEPILASPQIFSTVAFFQNTLESNPTGIGFLLESQVPAGMRVLNITSDEPIPNSQYVLAITPVEPEGRLKALLICLQNLQ